MVDDERDGRVAVVAHEREAVTLGERSEGVHVGTQPPGPGFQVFDSADGAPPLRGGVELGRVDAEFPTGVLERVGVRASVECTAEAGTRVESVPVERIIQRGGVDRGGSAVPL